MNQTEAVNSSVKPKVSSLSRYDFTSLGQVIKVPGGRWVKFDDVWEMLNYHGKRTEDSFSDETRGKIPVDPQKPILDDSAKDYDGFFEEVAEVSGAMPIHRKSREDLMEYLRRQRDGSAAAWRFYDIAKTKYTEALLELAKANKGIRRLRKKLDAAKRKSADSPAFPETDYDRERNKRWYRDMEAKYPNYVNFADHRGRIPIGDGKVLTSEGDILPG